MVRWEEGSLPWKDKKRKRRQLKNLLGALENSQTKIYSKNSEQTTRKNPEQNDRKFHRVLLTCTFLLPGAVQS